MNQTLTETKPRLGIVIGSTRPGRIGLPIGVWVYETALAHGAFEPEILDLGEINLPLLDEPHHPNLGQYTKQHTLDWSARVKPLDAFIFVTPEYNYGMGAALKNAIDFLHHEWHYKPVAFVSYGGIAAGTRAVQQLKQVVTTLKMTPIYDAVAIPFASRLFDEERHLTPNESMERGIISVLNELEKVNSALRILRQPATVER